MAKAPRVRYSPELKQQAVKMEVEEDFGVSETARRLSLPTKTLANWLAQYRQDKEGFAAKAGAGERRSWRA